MSRSRVATIIGKSSFVNDRILQEIAREAKDSYFIDCSNGSKSGIVDYVLGHSPKYLLLNELDKLSRKDQTFLLNLIETGLI